ncbi:DUF348 domain-containing protein [Microlunatus elymi]|uniref:DUF348 domain-containing protein n=1 Tax=Microlunatus elymi TaxID=2596828 RepID=A0A516Q3G2_9ACTN|nr:resuscitation-promoting factor [Microlunatus elymi]QDP97960.1 DUF348 domain-containing protein [Microlunatus elymi]
MRKILPIVAAGAVVVAASGGTFAYASADKQVTLSVDGRPQTVNTFQGSVSGLLKSRGITVSDRDEVAPSLNSKLTEGAKVSVRYGRQVTVNVDGEQKTFWTTAQSVGAALQLAGLTGKDADLSTSRSAPINRQGLSLTMDTSKSVKITAGGKTKTVRTTAGTVGAALKVAKVSVDDNDKVSKALSAKLADGTTIKVTKVSTKTLTKTKRVDYDVVHRKTKKLDRGETRVDTDGKAGERTYTYLVTKYDGKEHDRRLISQELTTDPVDEVVLVGTHKPKPQRDTTDTGNSGDSGNSKNSGSTAASVPSGSVWDRLAQCEAGGNWHINTGNGFYGGLQFTLQTWRAYGGSGMPNQASREQQIAVGKKIQASQGWGAWPACSSRLGLR